MFIKIPHQAKYHNKAKMLVCMYEFGKTNFYKDSGHHRQIDHHGLQ